MNVIEINIFNSSLIGSFNKSKLKHVIQTHGYWGIFIYLIFCTSLYCSSDDGDNISPKRVK